MKNGYEIRRGINMKRYWALLFALALVVAACGNGAEEVPTTAGESGATTTTAAETTDTTTPEETTTVAESHDPVNLAFSSATPQVEKVPTIDAMALLESDGHEVSTLFLQKSEDPVAAVVRGDANFASASASAVFTAIAKDAPIVAVMQANAPNYALVAPVDVSDPGGLDGLRVGIHAQVSSTTLYTEVALADYPDVEPEILIVPGSAKRIEALVAGELDASVVQLADLPKLEELAPGKFHVIYNFAQENPELVDSVVFVARDTLENNPQIVEQFIAANLAAIENAYEDVEGLGDRITELVPDTSAELGQELAGIYTDAGLWPRDGGLTAEGIEATLNALGDNGILEDVPAAADVYDRGPLESVLAR